MNIDWSKAPEDATHAGTYKGKFSCWYKLGSGWAWEYMSALSFSWEKAVVNRPASDLIERPKKQESWGGEGLPPVNCFCETLDEDADCWVKVEIYAHTEFMGETHACAKNGTDMFFGLAHEFRPIKTAEQLAEEEREKEAIELYLTMQPASNSKAWDNIGDYARDRYRLAISSGYRKQ